MSYDNWKARLAGEPIKTFLQAQPEDEGYYRRPLFERHPDGRIVKLPNGRPIQTGWEPVAYFLSDDGLCGVIGAGDSLRDMTDEEVSGEDIWSYCCRHPIAYELYKAVAEDGEPWPDQPPAPRRLSENQPTDEPEPDEPEPVPAAPMLPPHEAAAKKIDDAIAKAPVEVKNLAQAELASGAKNLIAAARLEATRDGEAAYKPPYNE